MVGELGFLGFGMGLGFVALADSLRSAQGITELHYFYGYEIFGSQRSI
jgi:hypothetical protein